MPPRMRGRVAWGYSSSITPPLLPLPMSTRSRPHSVDLFPPPNLSISTHDLG
jgi:hypothetical protein